MGMSGRRWRHFFGPNIIANLDKIGLTYNEAWTMVRNDIIMLAHAL